MGNNWKNSNTNFDNIISAILTLLIISTLDGWPVIMFSFMDANDQIYVMKINK